MIDIHLHIGKLYINEKPLTPSFLINFMDEYGIEKAVLLPIENPDETSYYVTTEYVLEVCKKYPDRFIPFCNVDPRRRDVYEVIKGYKERGCKGFGELLAGLYVDDPLMQNIYKICGELELPIIFDLCSSTCIDEIGFPRFESMIKKFPQTIFIGHGQHFWAEIASNIQGEDMGVYPDGKIISAGVLEKLFLKYDNLYADLSAKSGLTALTRDLDFGYKFLEKFQDRLFFGTDIARRHQKGNIVFYLRKALEEKKISQTVYNKITRENTIRILDL